jgi:hypothetical protein
MRAKSKGVTASILIASTVGLKLFRGLLQQIKAGQMISCWRYLAATNVVHTPTVQTLFVAMIDFCIVLADKSYDLVTITVVSSTGHN